MSTQVFAAKPDPKVGKRCAQCRKPINITPRAGLNPATYIDPFCSSKCARLWHGVPVPGGITEREGRPPRTSRR